MPAGPYLERLEPAARGAFAAALDRLARAGIAVREVPAFADFDALEGRHRRLVAAEAARVHRAWLPAYRSLYRARTLELIDRGATIDEAELERLRASRGALPPSSRR